jgi:hypothetical protein
MDRTVLHSPVARKGQMTIPEQRAMAGAATDRQPCRRSLPLSAHADQFGGHLLQIEDQLQRGAAHRHRISRGRDDDIGACAGELEFGASHGLPKEERLPLPSLGVRRFRGIFSAVMTCPRILRSVITWRLTMPAHIASQ